MSYEVRLPGRSSFISMTSCPTIQYKLLLNKNMTGGLLPHSLQYQYKFCCQNKTLHNYDHLIITAHVIQILADLHPNQNFLLKVTNEYHKMTSDRWFTYSTIECLPPGQVLRYRWNDLIALTASTNLFFHSILKGQPSFIKSWSINLLPSIFSLTCKHMVKNSNGIILFTLQEIFRNA